MIREARGNLELLAKLLDLGQKDTLKPPSGSSPANPLFVAEVGYDINALMQDPELREMVLAVDKRMKALTGGEGIILKGAVRTRRIQRRWRPSDQSSTPQPFRDRSGRCW